MAGYNNSNSHIVNGSDDSLASAGTATLEAILQQEIHDGVRSKMPTQQVYNKYISNKTMAEKFINNLKIHSTPTKRKILKVFFYCYAHHLTYQKQHEGIIWKIVAVFQLFLSLYI